MSCNHKHKGAANKVGKVILMVLGAAAFALAIGALAMVLWNWLMPTIFGLTVINYWQAFGIVLLAKLLFGFGMGGGKDHDKESKDDTSGIGGEIKNGIKNEIRREFRKDFHKEMDKEMGKEFVNARFDDVYEDWWKKEGAASFENYMNDKEQPDKE